MKKQKTKKTTGIKRQKRRIGGVESLKIMVPQTQRSHSRTRKSKRPSSPRPTVLPISTGATASTQTSATASTLPKLAMPLHLPMPSLHIHIPRSHSSSSTTPTTESETETSDMELAIGKPWFEDYYKAKNIGEGGFGSVFSATKQNEQYAVKVIKVDDSIRELVKNEIAILEQLREHCDKHILCYVDHYPKNIDTHNGNVYIVCEYLQDYVQLLDVIDKPGLSHDTMYKIICNICDGIRAIHDLGVTHRDIKPENIMVSTRDFAIKYIDFGLAYAEMETYTTPRYVKRKLFGTTAYMDPSLTPLNRKNMLDFENLKQADIFALGVTVYEIMSGAYGPCEHCHLPVDVQQKCARNIEAFNVNQSSPLSSSSPINLFNLLTSQVTCPRKRKKGDKTKTQFSEILELNRVLTERAIKEDKRFGYLPEMWLLKKLHNPSEPITK